MSNNSKKVALITGITGQDGSYCGISLEKNYIVHGIKRRSSSFNTGRIDHIYQDPHEDLEDSSLWRSTGKSTNLTRRYSKKKLMSHWSRRHKVMFR